MHSYLCYTGGVHQIPTTPLYNSVAYRGLEICYLHFFLCIDIFVERQIRMETPQNGQGDQNAQLETEPSASGLDGEGDLANSGCVIVTEREVTEDVAACTITCDDSCFLCKDQKRGAENARQISNPEIEATIRQKSGEDILECLARLVADSLRGSQMNERVIDLEANVARGNIRNREWEPASSGMSKCPDRVWEDNDEGV